MDNVFFEATSANNVNLPIESESGLVELSLSGIESNKIDTSLVDIIKSDNELPFGEMEVTNLEISVEQISPISFSRSNFLETRETFEPTKSTKLIPAESFESTKGFSLSGLSTITDPRDTIQNGKSKNAGFLKQFGLSLAHSLIQSPMEGFAQLIDNTIGKPFDTNLHGYSRDLVVNTPEATVPYSWGWYGQTIGGAVGIIPYFLATRKALRKAADGNRISQSLVVSPSELALNKGVFSKTGIKAMVEGGTTGAAYAGIFRPIGEGEGNYWTAKAKHMTTDFATFSTLTGGSLWLNPKLTKASSTLAQTYMKAEPLIRKGNAMVGGALSGLPASLVNSGMHSSLFEGKLPSREKLMENAVAFSVIGGAISPFHHTPKLIESKKPLVAAENVDISIELKFSEAIKNLDRAKEPGKLKEDINNLERIKEPGKLKEAMVQLLKSPDANGHPKTIELFYRSLSFPETALEAARHINKLPENERSSALATLVAHYPETKPIAVEAIPSLPKSSQDVIKVLLEEPSSRVSYLSNIAKSRPLTELESAIKAEALRREEVGPITVKSENIKLIYDSWSRLHPEYWKDLSIDQARVLAELIDTKPVSDPMIDVYKDAIKNDGFANWYQHDQNGSKLSSSELAHIGMIWKEFPQSYRQLPAESFKQVTQVWSQIPSEVRQKIPAEKLVAFAETVRDLRLENKSVVELSQNLDFAEWYSKAKSEFQISDSNKSPDQILNRDNILELLKSWTYLTSSQKNLPVKELLHNTKIFELKGKLSEYFAKPETDYFLDLYKNQGFDPGQLIQFANQITNRSHKDSLVKIVGQLVKDKSPASEFSPENLGIQLAVEVFFPKSPEVKSKLLKLVSDGTPAESLYQHLAQLPPSVLPVVEKGILSGLRTKHLCQPEIGEFIRLNEALPGLSKEGSRRLVDLINNRVVMRDLLSFIEQNPRRAKIIEDLIHSGAKPKQFRLRVLEDQLVLSELKTQFKPTEFEILSAFQAQGLSALRLRNYLQAEPERLAVVKEMLQENHGYAQIHSLIDLSILPVNIAYKIVNAAKNGSVRTADIIGKLNNWQTGSKFRESLISHVENGKPIDSKSLALVYEKAKLDSVALTSEPVADPVREPAAEPTKKSDRNSIRINQDDPLIIESANTFKQAADAIASIVPVEKTIVLLGRDAWPLLPLLRSQGRKAQYFLWSRLQSGDAKTVEQWLKEVPPDSVVIDTGYKGSIIDLIKEYDPGVTGYLLSSEVKSYQTLLMDKNHRALVDKIENGPKVISKTSRHTEDGRAISRRPSKSSLEQNKTESDLSVWTAEKYNQDLLTAMGLSPWESWRYSKFTGLTPIERLGFDSKTQLENHYLDIKGLRARD